MNGGYMGKPHAQEKLAEDDAENGQSANDEKDMNLADMNLNLDSDDDFTDDWISHVDDYDSSDDLNSW